VVVVQETILCSKHTDYSVGQRRRLWDQVGLCLSVS